MAEIIETTEKKGTVQVKVEYLPSPRPYEHPYVALTPLASVRSEAMAFFRVSDHKDRDQHEFFLVYPRNGITNLSQTIAQLVGESHEAKLDLVVQITPGIIELQP